MFNNDFRKFRFIEVIEKDSPEEMKNFLANISIPCEVVFMYAYEGTHYAYINFSKPFRRPQLIKKSPRDTDKKYKES